MEPDVLVVGGGGIGACVAYELAREGAAVALVEKGPRLASGCSAGNAGLIHPSHATPLATPQSLRQGIAWMLRRDSPFYLRPRPAIVPWLVRFAAASTHARARAGTAVLRSLGAASLDLHVELAAQGLDGGFERRGVLHVYETERGFAVGREEARASRAAGLNVEVLGADEARAVEPALSAGVKGAAYYPEEAQCDPERFVEAVGRAAAELGARVETGVSVERLRPSRGRVEVVETSAGPVRPGSVVLAAGAWTGPLARTAGLYVPVEAGKGYHAEVDRGERPPAIPVFMQEARVIATPYADRVRLAGALELTGLDLRIDPVRVGAVVAAARRNVATLAGLPVRRTWAGLRPCAPDGLPIVGRPERYENLVLATGHAMMGLTLAPITGRLVAELVASRTPSHDLRPLSPDRFRPFLRRPPRAAAAEPHERVAVGAP